MYNYFFSFFIAVTYIPIHEISGTGFALFYLIWRGGNAQFQNFCYLQLNLSRIFAAVIKPIKPNVCQISVIMSVRVLCPNYGHRKRICWDWNHYEMRSCYINFTKERTSACLSSKLQVICSRIPVFIFSFHFFKLVLILACFCFLKRGNTLFQNPKDRKC